MSISNPLPKLAGSCPPLIIALFFLCGCQGIEFQHNYASYQKSEPKVQNTGAWRGTWNFDGETDRRPARVVIFQNSDSKYTIQIELRDFEPWSGRSTFGKYWIFLKDVPLSQTSNDAFDFSDETQTAQMERKRGFEQRATVSGSLRDEKCAIKFAFAVALPGHHQGSIVLTKDSANPNSTTTDSLR